MINTYKDIIKSPLKWAGGKAYLVPTIKEYFNKTNCNRVVEPFCGSAAISFGLNNSVPKLINDINLLLINFFKYLKYGLLIKNINIENTKENYYVNRKLFNNDLISESINLNINAQLFYYLNRHCYNGLFRVNKKNEFNVPYGKYKSPIFLTDLTHYVPKIDNWTITCGDFSNISIQEKDFVYIDSPYVESFTKYTPNGFNWNDQLRLAKWCNDLNVPIVISNKATTGIIELYSDYGFNCEYIMAPRKISCNGDRMPVKEVLFSKNISL